MEMDKWITGPANIAEGYGRIHRGDYVRHLSIVRTGFRVRGPGLSQWD